jgi:hypothetical protein
MELTKISRIIIMNPIQSPDFLSKKIRKAAKGSRNTSKVQNILKRKKPL